MGLLGGEAGERVGLESKNAFVDSSRNCDRNAWSGGAARSLPADRISTSRSSLKSFGESF